MLPKSGQSPPHFPLVDLSNVFFTIQSSSKLLLALLRSSSHTREPTLIKESLLFQNGMSAAGTVMCFFPSARVVPSNLKNVHHCSIMMHHNVMHELDEGWLLHQFDSECCQHSVNLPSPSLRVTEVFMMSSSQTTCLYYGLDCPGEYSSVDRLL